MERTSDFDKLPFLYMTMAKALAWNSVVPTETLTIVSLTESTAFDKNETDLYKYLRKNDDTGLLSHPFSWSIAEGRPHSDGCSDYIQMLPEQLAIDQKFFIFDAI